MATDKAIEFFHKCKRSFDPDDDKKHLLLHPKYYNVIYRGYIDTETGLPNGHGVQYKSNFNFNCKQLSIDGTIYYIAHRCRAGFWVQGLLSGDGYQYYNKNYMYRGRFLNDKPHGKGTFYKNKVIDQTGTWKSGNIYDGYGTIFYEDGSRYKGYAINGMRSGEGIQFDSSEKEVKCGRWFNDEFIRYQTP
tara:strand:+ start:81 stop:650 length:570 start_codon:yes stop_codon:yes gene_type:complete